jgi:hypothetical protein
MTAPHPEPTTSLAWIALLTALLPFGVVHICYGLSVQEGYIPGCVPYLSGCTSISASGRHGTSYFLFKAGMIPAAVVMAAFWALCRRWLIAVGASDNGALHAMVWIGVTAAAFLTLYAIFLGSKGDFYNLMRRYGVTVYFSFSYLSQLILLNRLYRLRRQGLLRLPARILRGKLTIAVALLAVGLLSILIKPLLSEPDRLENAIEWIFALLLVSYYALTWSAWRETDFRAGFSAVSGARRPGA